MSKLLGRGEPRERLGEETGIMAICIWQIQIQEQVVQGNREGRLRDGQYWVGRRLTGLIPALLIHYLHFIFPREKKWDI